MWRTRNDSPRAEVAVMMAIEGAIALDTFIVAGVFFVESLVGRIFISELIIFALWLFIVITAYAAILNLWAQGSSRPAGARSTR